MDILSGRWTEDTKTTTGRQMLIEVLAHQEGIPYSQAEKKVIKKSASAIEKDLNARGIFWQAGLKSWKTR